MVTVATHEEDCCSYHHVLENCLTPEDIFISRLILHGLFEAEVVKTIAGEMWIPVSGVRVAIHHQHLLLTSVSILTLYSGKKVSSVWSAVWKAVCLVLKQIWPDLHWMNMHCSLLAVLTDVNIGSLWSLNRVPSVQAAGGSCKNMWPRGSC